MTSYTLSEEVMDRYFASTRRATNIAVTMAADHLKAFLET